MTLRCKPGDLAVVIRDFEDPRNVGALVKVRRPADRAEYRIPADWECEAVSLIRFRSFVAYPGQSGFAYRDCELRPIRDPGEDAQDETLEWLPVPQQERSMA